MKLRNSIVAFSCLLIRKGMANNGCDSACGSNKGTNAITIMAKPNDSSSSLTNCGANQQRSQQPQQQQTGSVQSTGMYTGVPAQYSPQPMVYQPAPMTPVPMTPVPMASVPVTPGYGSFQGPPPGSPSVPMSPQPSIFPPQQSSIVMPPPERTVTVSKTSTMYPVCKTTVCETCEDVKLEEPGNEYSQMPPPGYNSQGMPPAGSMPPMGSAPPTMMMPQPPMAPQPQMMMMMPQPPTMMMPQPPMAPQPQVVAAPPTPQPVTRSGHNNDCSSSDQSNPPQSNSTSGTIKLIVDTAQSKPSCEEVQQSVSPAPAPLSQAVYTPVQQQAPTIPVQSAQMVQPTLGLMQMSPGQSMMPSNQEQQCFSAPTAAETQPTQYPSVNCLDKGNSDLNECIQISQAPVLDIAGVEFATAPNARNLGGACNSAC